MNKKNKCCISGECLNIAAVALANTIAKDLTINEAAQLSILFTVVGDALGVIATTRTLCESQDSDSVTII